MQVQINYGDVDGSPALADHVNEQVEKSVAHNAEHVTRVEVHLRDDKAKRHGPDDKRCMMEARLEGKQPLAVEARAGDLYKAVIEAAGKLGRAVRNEVDKRKERH